MRRSLRLALAGIAAAALTVGVAAPVGAQEPLGFEIDKTQGLPGEVVNGQVNVADVAAHCTTTVEGLQARFGELLAGPYNPEPGVELFDRIFPGGEFVFENHTQAAYSLTGLMILGLSGFIGPEPAEEALPQTFVMTFADIATQEPVGERGNFDPDTGEGSVVVPDVDPGLWAVAATCVGPTLDVDLLEAGLEESAAFLQEIGAPADINSPEFGEFIRDFLDDEQAGVIDAFVPAIAPELLQNIVELDGLGVQLFTVLTPQEALAALIADIEDLVADGELSAGYARGLTRLLENATRSLDGDNIEAACDQLDGVSDRSIPETTLDPATAEDLIAQVEAIEAHLDCT
jgi:hypothetical protein